MQGPMLPNGGVTKGSGGENPTQGVDNHFTRQNHFQDYGPSPHSDLINGIHQQVSTFVLNKVARQLNELEMADRLHSHLQNSMNSQTYLQNYFHPMSTNPSGVLNVQLNRAGTQSQPVVNLGGIPFPPPYIPAGPAQNYPPPTSVMSGPPKNMNQNREVPGQAGIQPKYLEERERHLRNECQADSTIRDSSRHQKVVTTGETSHDSRKREERPPAMSEEPRKGVNHRSESRCDDPNSEKQMSRRLSLHQAENQPFIVEGQPVFYTQDQNKSPKSQNKSKQHFLWKGRPRRGRI